MRHVISSNIQRNNAIPNNTLPRYINIGFTLSASAVKAACEGGNNAIKIPAITNSTTIVVLKFFIIIHLLNL